MVQIVLDDRHSELVSGAQMPVQILDREGRLLGYLTPQSELHDIAEARRALASDQPRYPTKVVLERLRSWELSEGCVNHAS